MRRSKSDCGRMFAAMWVLIVALGAGCLALPAWAAAPSPPGRVLFIGIDGCRFDALQAANAPNLDALRADGCFSRHTLILGGFRGSDTVSGPGWSSLLTGVWADKHGVLDNRFTSPNYQQYPHFFHYVKARWPKAVTVSIANWPPINDRILSDADIAYQPTEAGHYIPGDADGAAKAAAILRLRDPTAMFVYFGQVDETGHQFGFHPAVEEYITAIERVDGHVGKIVAALRSRPRFAAENWLILVSSDHGGAGNDHGGGHNIPEIVNSFLIVSGAAASRGEIKQPTYLVDVPVTALVHLGVTIDPAWKLDGHPVGLRSSESPKPDR